MAVYLDQLVKLGPRLGSNNEAMLMKCVTKARAGDLGPLAQLVKDLEEGVGIGSGSGSGAASDYSAEVIQEVDAFAKVASSNNSKELAECVQMVQKLFRAQLDFLQVVDEHSKPGDDIVQKLLGPTASTISEIQSHREKHRGSPVFNHLSMVSESIPSLGWVGVSPAPVPFIREMRDAGQFYANRVLREKKEDKKIVDAWIGVLSRLGDFVKTHYTTGLVWKANGPSYVHTETSKTSSSSVKPTEEKKKPKQVVYGAAKSAAVEKLALEGKKWMVEHFKGKNDIQISDGKSNQSVYIYKCENSVIKVSGKCNNLVINSCKKVGVVFDSLISSAEVINSSGVELQVLGTVPTVTLDKTDGAQIYLSKDSEGAEIVTAKTAGVNVIVTSSSGDIKEHPVPEQYKTIVKGTKLTTSAVEAF